MSAGHGFEPLPPGPDVLAKDTVGKDAMNDELELTEDQLRRATSRAPIADAALDAETAAMRDSFLSLGSAIESAAADFDEDALIANLRGSMAAESTSALQPAARNDSRPKWWLVVLAGALAASALIAIGRIGVVEREPVVAVNVPPTNGAAEFAVASTWHDPLDEQIASAQTEVQQLAVGNRGLDGSLSEMNDKLEAMSRELLGESL